MIIALGKGSIMFYLLLFQSKLIPQWHPAMEMNGAILAITTSLLVMFYIVEIIIASYVALNVPLALQEMTLAIWLIFNGFNTYVLDSN
jgi:hypothetical protein